MRATQARAFTTSSDPIKQPEPFLNPVPTGENPAHQPSLTLANVRVTYGWQATRRLSAVALPSVQQAMDIVAERPWGRDAEFRHGS